MRPAPVGLGDVFRAIAAIAPDDPARWPDIAAMLGFESPRTAAADRAAGALTDGAAPTAARPRAIKLDEVVARQEAGLPALAPRAADAGRGAPEPFLLRVDTLAAEPAEPAEPAATGVPAAPGLMPLFGPATAPSILRATVVVPESRGPLDVGALVDTVARRRNLQRLPRRRSFSIARDVLVLQDLGPGMDAFIEDVEPFIAALQDVAGRSVVRVGSFIGRPAEALADAGCHRGTAVVVLSDLGLGALAGADERGVRRWLELAEATARVGARTTVLVPWPAERWPADIASRLALATWDRTTGVAQVMRAVREHG